MALEADIRAHQAQLKARYPAVTDCRVNIEDRPAHRFERRRYNVRLDVSVPGRALVINREHDDDPAAALGAAFEAASRALDPLPPGS